MATKSIVKNLTLRDRRLIHSFVNVLEKAESREAKNVVITKKVSEVTDAATIKSIVEGQP